MKRVALGLFIALLGVSFVAADADARRLGGGASSGLKRQTPPPAQPAQPAQTPPAAQKQAATPAPANTAAAPAAPAPRRSWLGPIAGIAAGLGLAALMSHLGLGAEFGSLLTMLLIGIVAVFAIRFLMRRFAGAAPRPAGAGAGGWAAQQPASAGAPFDAPAARSIEPSFAAPPAAASHLPADFDAAAFERAAKLIFIRMQAANDAGDLTDLRRFSTPEMFATFRLELQDRRGTAQRTDVVRLDAQVLDVAEETDRQIVSVRFHGLIREEHDGPAHDFDEVWHLAKPADGSSEWAIAGIAQSEAA